MPMSRKPVPKLPLSKFENESPLTFPEETYSNLPVDLKELCLLIDDPQKRDVFLISQLTALSAAMSRFRFLHGSSVQIKEYSPHLMSFIVGGPGSGKGMAEYGSVLIQKIEDAALERHTDAQKKYKVELLEYQREIKERTKTKMSFEGLIEPEKPGLCRFAISASDTTQAALVQVLYQNPWGGYAFDAEADTLVQGDARKDFGGFSDIIRKAFHHEQLSRQRKGEGETYNVRDPRLSLLLCGTPDQAQKLIKNESNGLFSRLLYYFIPPDFRPYSRMTASEDIIGNGCMRLQQKVLDQAQFWTGSKIIYTFSDDQEGQLEAAMQDKEEVERKWGQDIGASWIRMAIIIKRIAVTLSAFKGADEGVIPDDCWASAISMLPGIKGQCIEVLKLIREQTKGRINISQSVYEDMKRQDMTDEQIAKQFGCNRTTIARKKKEWTE